MSGANPTRPVATHRQYVTPEGIGKAAHFRIVAERETIPMGTGDAGRPRLVLHARRYPKQPVAKVPYHPVRRRKRLRHLDGSTVCGTKWRGLQPAKTSATGCYGLKRGV